MAFQNEAAFTASAVGQDTASLECHSPQAGGCNCSARTGQAPRQPPPPGWFRGCWGDIPQMPQKRKVSVQNSAQYRGEVRFARKKKKQNKPNKQTQQANSNTFHFRNQCYLQTLQEGLHCISGGGFLVTKMRVCLLKVIIKEINYLDQPKPHQGLAKQLHTVPVVAQRCTVAQPPPLVSAARPRTGSECHGSCQWQIAGLPSSWRIGQTGQDLLN